MKYGKLINNNFDIKEVEKGMEIGGLSTEQQLIIQGYKPVCETEKPLDAEYYVYREYDACFVQDWRIKEEPLREGDIWTSDIGVNPSMDDILRIQKDLMFIKSSVNTYNLNPSDALKVKDMFPDWEAGLVVNVGERYLYEDTLWEVVQAHTTQENWKPSVNTATMWKVVQVSHEGTLEDPIPYVQMMAFEKGKYYSQYGETYLCILTTITGYPSDLKDLPTIVQKVEK